MMHSKNKAVSASRGPLSHATVARTLLLLATLDPHGVPRAGKTDADTADAAVVAPPERRKSGCAEGAGSGVLFPVLPLARHHGLLSGGAWQRGGTGLRRGGKDRGRPRAHSGA